MLLTTITGVDPLANSHDASTSTDVAATFDQDVVAGSATPQNFVVHGSQSQGFVAGTVSAAGPVITHNPTRDFAAGEVVQVTSTAGISTTGGTANKRVWQFRTSATGSGELADTGQTLPTAAAQYVSLGDVDGDGDADAVLGNSGAVLVNDGTGFFTDSGQALTPGGDLELADIDSDGDLDVVGTNEVWTNNGSGLFTDTAQAFGGGTAVAVGDLDGDGDLDAMVGIAYTSNRVFFNDGNGNFTNSGQTNLGTASPSSIEFGDLDGDGDLDAFKSNNGIADRVWLNDGNGTFTDSGQQMGGFQASQDVELGDLDGDGDLDAFVVDQQGANSVWLNDGSGVFANSGQSLGNHRSFGVALGDLDGDGDLDAFESNSWALNLAQIDSRIWLNDGSGNFNDSGQLFAPFFNYFSAIADLDGDGDLDVFMATNSQPQRVLLNQNLTPNVTLAVDNTSITEEPATATITATLSAVHTEPVTIDLEYSGSATPSDDYTASGSQIVIAAGATSGSVTVTSVQDAVDDDDETIVVDVSNVTNGQEVGTQQVTVTIIDDDDPIPVPEVTLAVDNAAIPEEAGVATFTANLSVVTTVPVTIDFALSGTADASDYSASATQIVVPAGSTSGSITVTATQDTIDEPDETVVVDIANVVGGTEAGAQQQVTTITDDDEPPVPDVTLTVDTATIPEAAGVANFTITLSEATTVPVTVDVAVTGTAGAGDYTISGTQVTIAPGATSGTVSVTAVQDELDEPDETIIVEIANVAGGNEVGDQQQSTLILDDDIPPSFAVTSLAATDSGFVVNFTNPLDGADLNLYDTQNANMGAADVVVSGATVGNVTGSIIVGESSVEFVKSGGPMEADTYTVTLRSATDGFEDTGGMLLDGNGDGTGGDDYQNTWTVAAVPEGARTVSIPDFVRGPGQDVNLPADGTTGIPISISEGANVRAADIRISYDPALLSITGATAPAGGTVVVNTSTPGLAILVYFATTALPAGPSDFIQLQATVPAENASANYQRQQLVDLHDVVIGDGNDNEFPVVVDDALHFATYFADVSGNGRINASDAAQVARYAALIDSGFVASLNTDPILVGDISGNGRINAADASRVAQFAALIEVPEIPPVPGGIVVTGLPQLPDAVRAPEPGERRSSEASEAAVLEWELPPRAEWGSSPDSSHDLIMAAHDDEERLNRALEEAIEELFSSSLFGD